MMVFPLLELERCMMVFPLLELERCMMVFPLLERDRKVTPHYERRDFFSCHLTMLEWPVILRITTATPASSEEYGESQYQVMNPAPSCSEDIPSDMSTGAKQQQKLAELVSFTLLGLYKVQWKS
jgi:hypothetical protein